MDAYDKKVIPMRVYPHADPEEPLPASGYSDWPTVIVLLAAWLVAIPITIGLVEVIKHWR